MWVPVLTSLYALIDRSEQKPSGIEIAKPALFIVTQSRLMLLADKTSLITSRVVYASEAKKPSLFALKIVSLNFVFLKFSLESLPIVFKVCM